LFGHRRDASYLSPYLLDYTKYIHYKNTRIVLTFGADQS